MTRSTLAARRAALVPLFAAVVGGLAACGGNDDPAATPVSPAPPTSTPVSNGSASPGIYVTNGNNTVTVFSLDATGNAAPLRTIAGDKTTLSLPIGIALDHEGNLYVANRTGGSVSVYPSDASGNVAPTRSITAAGMGSPQGIAFGPGDDMYVATCPNCGAGNGGDTGVFHFAADATASDYELAGANTGFTVPVNVSLDQDKNVYVGNAFGGNVSVFAPGASGNTLPIRSFTMNVGGNAQSMAIGPDSGANALAVGMPGRGVQLYDTTASGAVDPAATLATSSDFPLSYPAGVFFDNSVSPPVVYVNDYGASAIYVIQTAGTAPDLTIASVRTIAGGATGLSAPLGITVVH